MTSVAHPRLHERDDEVSVLVAALDSAAAGRFRAVVIDGEPGIGKSRLLDEVSAHARERGFAVLTGVADDLERGRPFGVLARALGCTPASPDPRRAAIAEMLGPRAEGAERVTVTSDAGLLYQVVDAVGDLLEELALETPVVLGLDDLQWADPSTLLALASLQGRLAYVPFVLVAAMRPAPRTDRLRQVVDSLLEAGADRLSPTPLSERAVAALAEDVAGGDLDRGVLDRVDGAGGNPLFVTELVRTLLEAGVPDPEEADLPVTMRRTIRSRVQILSEEARDMLRPASVLGTSFTLTELAHVTRRSAFDLSAPVQESIRAGILTDDGDRLRFRHDVIREATYSDMTSSVRTGLHRATAEHLAASGGSAMRVAEHLLRATEPGDREAVDWLVRAAHEVSPISPVIAADALERAVEILPPGGGGRDALLVELAGNLLWAGRLDETEEICRELLDRPHDPDVDAAARETLGRCLLADGRMQPALDELEAVCASPTATKGERAAAWGAASTAHVFLGRLDEATAAAKQAEAAADDDAAASLALKAQATAQVFRGHPRAALDLVDAAVRRADESPWRTGHRHLHHMVRGHVLLELDRFEEARATLETGMRIGEELGARWSLAAYQLMLAVERFTVGAWDDALCDIEDGLGRAGATGERYNVAVAHSMVALIALHRNDRETAERAVSAAETVARDGPRYRSHWWRWIRALLAEVDGDRGEALRLLRDSWQELTLAGTAIEYPVIGPDLVRLAVTAGDHALAAEVTARVAAVAEENDVASMTGAALRCRGLADQDPDTLARAMEAYARTSRSLELAMTREEAGVAVAERGQRQAAAELLDQALEGYERLGATWDVARVRAALRGLGVHRGQRGVRSRPQSGWASLTPTERTVSELVAEGLTNPQIGERLYVSRRTVQTHVGHIFAKLQMSSRAELAAAVARGREQA